MRHSIAPLAVALLLLAACGAPPPAQAPAAETKPAPGFELKDLSGKTVKLSDSDGTVRLVDFWATWCAPCREEMPAFTQLQRRWGARGVQFVGVSSEDAAKVARFGRELAINYPLWVGEAAAELSRRLGNSAGVLPYSVVLDGSGKVLEQKVGPYRDWELDAILGKYAAKGS